MKTFTFALFATSTCFSVCATAQDFIDEVVHKIESEKFKCIAVIPNTISVNEDKPTSTVGRLGARGKSLADNVYQQLRERAAAEGTYTVVEKQDVQQALQELDFSLTDLENFKKIRLLGEKTGADGIVVPRFREDQSKPTVDAFETGLVKANNSMDRGEITVKKAKTLSDAAYQGESWWLRKWEGNRLVDRNLIDLRNGAEFGKGPEYEAWQYENLDLEKALHPLEENCPYQLEILVDGTPRKPIKFGKKFAVELNRDEVYSLRVANHGNKNVYAAVFVDGIIVVDGVRANNGVLDPGSVTRIEPGDLKLWRHFLFRAGNTAVLPGWYQIRTGSSGSKLDTYTSHEFKIVRRDDSAAAGTSFENNIGMITAIFYTQGMDGIPQPDREQAAQLKSRSFPQADGTGLGKRSDRNIKWVPGAPRGIILAAVSYHYRSREQLNQLNQREASDSPGSDVLTLDESVLYRND